MARKPPRKAALYIDGNNWYHALKGAGVLDPIDLDYAKISKKLIGPRDWIKTTYYIGQVKQQGNRQLYADQRRFLTKIAAQDSRITYSLGRLEAHYEQSECAGELLRYLHSLTQRIDPAVFRDLIAIGNQHRSVRVMTEKAVDVHLAVDMVMDAHSGAFDDGYILSCDGDFTPVADAVRKLNRKIFAASPGTGAELAAAVNTFIPISKAWFSDCYV